jgi:hypothetical protein
LITAGSAAGLREEVRTRLSAMGRVKCTSDCDGVGGTRSVPIGDRDWDRPPSGRAAADLGGDGEGGDWEG